MLLGAYGFGISTIAGAPFFVALLVAMAAGLLFALLLGIPTLQLRGDYLAIVTISAAEIIRWIGRSTWLQEWTGGASGLQGRDYKGTFQDLSPLPDGRTTIGPLEYINTGSDSWWTRVFAWGRRRAGAALRLADHAQPPLGPRAQGHPRGRGRRPRPRQERLLVQAAVARAGRRARLPRRRALRAADHDRSRRDEPHDDVLRVDRAAARRGPPPSSGPCSAR